VPHTPCSHDNLDRDADAGQGRHDAGAGGHSDGAAGLCEHNLEPVAGAVHRGGERLVVDLRLHMAALPGARDHPVH